MYIRNYDESSLYSQIRYVHSLTGNYLCRSVGIIKTMLPEVSQRIRVLHYANAPVLRRKKPDVMI